MSLILLYYSKSKDAINDNKINYNDSKKINEY